MIYHNDFFSTGFGRVWSAHGPEEPSSIVEKPKTIQETQEKPDKYYLEALQARRHLAGTEQDVRKLLASNNIPRGKIDGAMGQAKGHMPALEKNQTSANRSSDALQVGQGWDGLQNRIKALENKYYNQGVIDRDALRKALFPNLDQTTSDTNNAPIALALPIVPVESQHKEESKIDPTIRVPINVAGTQEIIEINREDLKGGDFIGNLVHKLDGVMKDLIGAPDREQAKSETEPIVNIPSFSPTGQDKVDGEVPIHPSPVPEPDIVDKPTGQFIAEVPINSSPSTTNA